MSCILPGRAKNSVNLLRKVFHTRLDQLVKAGELAMKAMEANGAISYHMQWIL